LNENRARRRTGPKRTMRMTTVIETLAIVGIARRSR
jgi:hypothetical protein